MKSKIIITCILVGFIITLFAIFNFKCPYSFKENVLYTQNDVSGYNENEKENNNLVNTLPYVSQECFVTSPARFLLCTMVLMNSKRICKNNV